jgi:hypothetical protein
VGRGTWGLEKKSGRQLSRRRTTYRKTKKEAAD